jgi:hypothetical protein
VGAITLAAALSACALTRRAKPARKGGPCVFLPPGVCPMLTPKSQGEEADLRYIAPKIDWQQYTAAMIPPAAVFGDAKSPVPSPPMQALADVGHAALLTDAGGIIRIVQGPGKGVMKIQMALTNASAAVPLLRTVSRLVPHPRALATLKYVATATDAFVGSAQGEFMAGHAMNPSARMAARRIADLPAGKLSE